MNTPSVYVLFTVEYTDKTDFDKTFQKAFKTEI